MLYGCARSSDVTEQTLHDLLAGGQYVRAESVARAQMERQIQQSGAASREVAVWSELLVRALLLNGKGTDPNTLALARQAVESARPDGPMLVRSFHD